MVLSDVQKTIKLKQIYGPVKSNDIDIQHPKLFKFFNLIKLDEIRL